MAVARVPRALAERLGNDGTEGLITRLASTKAEWTDEVVTGAVERFERRLTTEISSLRVDFTRDLSSIRVELLKWSFLFWVGQVAAVAGLLAFMLRP